MISFIRFVRNASFGGIVACGIMICALIVAAMFGAPIEDIQSLVIVLFEAMLGCTVLAWLLCLIK